MMKMKFVVLVLAMLAAGIQSGYAQNNESTEAQKRLSRMNIPDLSEEQMEEIKDLRLKYMDESTAVRNQLGEKQAKLQTLRTAEKVDMGSINTLIDGIAADNARLMKLREDNHQQVRLLLTDEQRIVFDSKPPRGPRPGYGEGEKRQDRHNDRSDRHTGRPRR